MAVYDKNGEQIGNVYSKTGAFLEQAYDIEGNELIDSGSLVVMSYNVQQFGGLNANVSMQTEILNTYEPDIIGFQEVSGWNISGVLDDYDYAYLGLETGMAPAVVSKMPLSDVTCELFEHQNPQGGVRYQKCYFSKAGKTICWMNTHLAESSYESAKVAEAQEVFELVQNEEYFIVTGDFNTRCKSVNDTEYTTIMKQFVDAGYNIANCTEQFGFKDTWTSGSTASGTWLPCDHIITSANISMNSVFVDTTKIDVAAETGQSIDHLPIIAYLTIGEAPSRNS